MAYVLRRFLNLPYQYPIYEEIVWLFQEQRQARAPFTKPRRARPLTLILLLILVAFAAAYFVIDSELLDSLFS
jgi:hypothetical protein